MKFVAELHIDGAPEPVLVRMCTYDDGDTPVTDPEQLRADTQTLVGALEAKGVLHGIDVRGALVIVPLERVHAIRVRVYLAEWGAAQMPEGFYGGLPSGSRQTGPWARRGPRR